MAFSYPKQPFSLTMPNFHLEVLPQRQLQLWEKLDPSAAALHDLHLYLAGGTALALQIGHRQSLDFDFFSQQPAIAETISEWLQQFPDFLVREADAHTLHAEISGVKVSFIGNYKYPLVAEGLSIGKIQVASILDIGLMKLLAITHRATFRDYIDLAAIVRDHVPLAQLLEMSSQKYGAHFNVMMSLKALVSFEDLDPEMPTLLDKQLGNSWPAILTQAVKQIAR